MYFVSHPRAQRWVALREAASGSWEDGMNRRIVVILAGPVLTVAALAGCASASHHAASPVATRAAATAAADAARIACSEQVAWAKRGAASVQPLYADTGALSADASANNLPGVAKAGRQLASDATAAAALP